MLKHENDPDHGPAGWDEILFTIIFLAFICGSLYEIEEDVPLIQWAWDKVVTREVEK